MGTWDKGGLKEGSVTSKELTTVYKITNKDGKTRPGEYNETQWKISETRAASGEGDMCGPGWLHGYHHPLLAAMLNPTHGAYDPATMRLFRCKAIVGIRHPDKLGCTSITPIEEIEVPTITTTQRVAFALLVTKRVCKNTDFQTFADNWLSGKDRSPMNVTYTTNAATYAANAAAYAAVNAANASFAATYAVNAAAAYVCEKFTDKILQVEGENAMKVK